MRTDKNIAFKMRLLGKSYGEINKVLKIPKSTLSGWFSHLKLSTIARKRIADRSYKKSVKALITRNKNQTILARESAENIQQLSATEIQKFDEYTLKIIGASLYWAEGYKRPIITKGKIRTHHPVALTNSDPVMIKIFIKFLKDICLVPQKRIKADIRLYNHMNSEKVFYFWKKITGLPENNFGKIYLGISKSSQGKRPFNRLPYGTIMIRVNDTKLFYRIMGWVRGLSLGA